MFATAGTLDGGSYAVVDAPAGASYVLVSYESTNAACGDSTPPNSRGASGRVTLTRVDLDGGLVVFGGAEGLSWCRRARR